MQTTVTRLVADSGSVVLFEGTTQNDVGDVEIRFAVDHHCAQDLVDALQRDEEPVVFLEDWQILGVR